ncbi:DUF2182 domain-containing protein [Spartinivicinus poritis]|uniref:DUF2182 domain-containing protein n=1 Tax=Spartinivicinus poritis TaxID=2994640 RepID=A0ABT5UBX0_9GAMM|nr:DUF2182 domain-containing protein [Spartinivicinus sp. A2-2]MDE1463884.1 DUF2182 domain-containing protein [Spartinivicinus sp. A2-2]
MKAIKFQQSLFVPTTVVLVVVAWLVLFWWEQSPYSHYILHGPAASHGMHHHGPVSPAVVMYLLGWMLMCIAMMLPTTLPLIQIFHRIAASHSHRWLLVSLLISGYLLVWLLFGVVAHLAQWGATQYLFGHHGLGDKAWVLSTVLLLTAGAFQFSQLKYQCLDKCRTPLSFVMSYWRGSHYYRQAWLLGLHHGLYCVGCCWALMLLMFAVGTGSVAWMLLLGAVMAIEKNVSWGKQMAKPVGYILLLWGGGLVAQNI